jgi:hypothetical protein
MSTSPPCDPDRRSGVDQRYPRSCTRLGPGRASHIARPLIVSIVGGYPYTPGVTATRIGDVRCSTGKQELTDVRREPA